MPHKNVPVFERRSVTRTIINRDALFFFGGQPAPLPCCIRNVTNIGAGIALSDATAVPFEFDISFDRFRSRRVCRLVWRRDDFVGVAFTDEPPAAAS